MPLTARMMEDKDAITAEYKVIIDQLTDTITLDEEGRRLKGEAEVVLEMINQAVVENASKALDQAEYSRRYMELVSRFEAIKASIDDINEQRIIRCARRDKLADFSIFLQRDRLISDFDEKLWFTIECIKVDQKSQLTFVFESGHQIISGHHI